MKPHRRTELRTGSGIELSVRKSCDKSQGFSQERKVGKMYARIIIAELDLDVEHSTLVDATFWPRDACPPEKRIVTRDGSDGHVTQILFLEVRYFAVNAL
jgi:hypothetical protein